MISIKQFVLEIMGINENDLKQLSTTKRIQFYERVRKIQTKISKINNIEKIIFDKDCSRSHKHGTTVSGKRFSWYVNSGWCERSLFCGKLYIDNELIFTSGTIQKAIQYLTDN